MTLEQRIEAAAKALRLEHIENRSEDAWKQRARICLLRAFPELFSTPPTAWIAPWEATQRMVRAGQGWNGIHRQWQDMRDSYLSPQGNTPSE